MGSKTLQLCCSLYASAEEILCCSAEEAFAASSVVLYKVSLTETDQHFTGWTYQDFLRGFSSDLLLDKHKQCYTIPEKIFRFSQVTRAVSI